MNQYLHTFLSIHNILRWAVIIATMAATVLSLMNMQSKQPFAKRTRLASLFALISCDLQLLAGLAIYYLGGHVLMLKKGGAMANHYSRFFALEHPLSMLIGIILVHFAYNTVKGHLGDAKKLKRVFWASFVALFLFVSQTPWPSKRDISRPWWPASATEASADTVVHD